MGLLNDTSLLILVGGIAIAVLVLMAARVLARGEKREWKRPGDEGQ